MPSTILSDNGVSSGSAGLKTTAASDGALALQTTTAGGTATTAVTIDTSQRVAFVAGTAAAPAITTSGDTDTGIFFPAANTLAFTTNGTEDARFDSAGNFGLGVTPSAWGSLKSVDVSTFGGFFGFNNQAGVTSNAYYSGTSWTYKGSGPATLYQQIGGAHNWQIATSGTAGNAITFTQAMTLDASGNLGVGTTTPNVSGQTSNNKIITVSGGPTTSSSWGGIEVGNIYSGANQLIGFYGFTCSAQDSGYRMPAYIGTWLETGTTNKLGGNIRFHTQSDNTAGATERARIDSSGNLLVGTTSGGGYRLEVHKPSATPQYVNRTTNTGGLIDLAYNGSTIGSISTNGSTITYGGTSDYRLKENITPMIGALAAVAQLKPCVFTWKNTGIKDNGFIAHELQEVCPNAVVGEKDAVNEDGSIKPQQVDTSFLVATLTAAIQEQQAIIEQLKADVAALKGN